jgi:hypothetical protein
MKTRKGGLFGADMRRSVRLRCGLTVVMRSESFDGEYDDEDNWKHPWREWYEARIWQGRRMVAGVVAYPDVSFFPRGIIVVRALDTNAYEFMAAVKRAVATVHAKRFAGLP